jgi:preprotein translocase subunit YajC
MLISPAYAQAAGGGGDGAFLQLLPLVLIFVVFYFLLIRPQQKKMKMHRGMVSALKRGDKVVTGGGLYGTVTKVISDHELQVELAEGVRVKVVRSTIQEVLSKPEPADKSAAKEGGAADKPANDDGKSKGGILGGLGGLLGNKGDK